jgi:hypothetical protein
VTISSQGTDSGRQEKSGKIGENRKKSEKIGINRNNSEIRVLMTQWNMGKHWDFRLLSVSLPHFIPFHDRSPSEWTGLAAHYGWGWVSPRLEVEVWDRGIDSES